MLFNSYEFLVFMVAVTAIFYSLKSQSSRTLFLLLASLTFYGWWSYSHLVLLLLSILGNYGISHLIVAGSRKLFWLTVGIGLNILLLGFFKYADFLILTANFVPGVNAGLLGIVLPLAISFFTFQQIAFLVDTSEGKTSPGGLIDYALFVSFFPQLIAGPIVHHKEMMPQFRRRSRQLTVAVDLTVGLTLFAIGLFKKTVLADQFAIYADSMYGGVGNGRALGLIDAWGGALAYSLQIYFDFSGYSDMALGLARMVGIRLPLNFYSPYKAQSAIDFWRRWHISLSRYLRDYLYIPLGGNRQGGARRYANLMITMLLGGLWHGAGWTFVMWGGLHGAFLVINHGWRAATAAGRPLARFAFLGGWFGPSLTFLAVVIAWVFFRAESFAVAWTVLQSMIGLAALPGDSGPWVIASGIDGLWLVAGLFIVWFLPNSVQFMRRYRPAIDPTGVSRGREASLGPGAMAVLTVWRPTPAWACVLGMSAAAAIFGISDVSPFLYFQF